MSQRRYSAEYVRSILINDIANDIDESEEEKSTDSSEEDYVPSPPLSDESDQDAVDEEEPASNAVPVIRGRGRGRRRAGRPTQLGATAVPAIAGRGRGRGRAGHRGGRARPLSTVHHRATTTGRDTWIAKDNTEWKKQPFRQASGRQVAGNIMHTTPGPTRYASRNVDGPLSAFQLFMRKKYNARDYEVDQQRRQ